MYQKRSQVYGILLSIIDGFCAVISFFLAGILRYQHITVFLSSNDVFEEIITIFTVNIFICLMLRNDSDFFKRSLIIEAGNVIIRSFLIIGVLSAYLFITKSAYDWSRLTVIYYVIIQTLLDFWLRVLFKYYILNVKRNGKNVNQTILITTSSELEKVLKSFIMENGEYVYNITAAIAIDCDMVGKTVYDVPVVADGSNYVDYLRHAAVDEVVIHLPRTKSKYIKHMVFELEQMGIVVEVSIELQDYGVGNTNRIYRLGDYYVLAYANRFLDYRQIILKRIIDIAGSIVGIAITLIVTVFIAPAIKIESPGPLFFAQKRVGKNGRIFKIYKFRSMYKDAEERKKLLMVMNQMDGPMFKMEDDPRVTKVGRFIRKTSIDELPQFFNVLKGDMSLVGTRPPTLDEFEKYESYQKRRLSTKPGMTGLWQVSGRSDVKEFKKVVELDLSYIDNWSIVLDIKILVKTVFLVLSGKGAR